MAQEQKYLTVGKGETIRKVTREMGKTYTQKNHAREGEGKKSWKEKAKKNNSCRVNYNFGFTNCTSLNATLGAILYCSPGGIPIHLAFSTIGEN